MVRCGCASDTCACHVVAGDGVDVSGAGSTTNPYVVTATSETATGVGIEQNNVVKVAGADTLDFRGGGVVVTSGGPTEAIVTIAASGGSGTAIPAGTMTMFGGTAAPSGWLLCNGTSYLVAAYPDLYGAIGNRFGGTGPNFNVPNMADTFPIGASPTKIAGARAGSATKTLGTTNLPPHAHPMPHTHTTTVDWAHDATTTASDIRVTDVGDRTGGGGSRATVTTTTASPANTDNTGGGIPLDVMPPYLALTYIIKT